jgi:Icc-related predicted phosphoesterase
VPDTARWKLEIPKTDCDVIALVGDIDTGIRGVQWAVEQSNILGVDILYIVGNHEYFKGNIDSINRKVKEVAEGTRVYVLQNDFVDIKGYRFAGATLWTDLNLFHNRQLASNALRDLMNDYKRIRIKENGRYKRLHPKDTFKLNQVSLKYLEEQLSTSPIPTVVLTHHAPSPQSVDELYQNSMDAAAYASDLEAFITRYRPVAWLHGHTHTCKTYRIGDTLVATNQFGYLNVGECGGFDPLKIIEV